MFAIQCDGACEFQEQAQQKAAKKLILLWREKCILLGFVLNFSEGIFYLLSIQKAQIFLLYFGELNQDCTAHQLVQCFLPSGNGIIFSF